MLGRGNVVSEWNLVRTAYNLKFPAHFQTVEFLYCLGYMQIYNFEQIRLQFGRTKPSCNLIFNMFGLYDFFYIQILSDLDRL
jgi:hypothetical protein